MSNIEKIASLLDRTQEVPASLGNLHLSFIIGVLLVSLALCVFFRDSSGRTFRLIIGILFFVMLFGEVIKQTLVPLDYVDGALVRNYKWNSFPFQLCSTPLYILPIVAFFPECKLRDAAAMYIMTVGFIGGVAVYATPFTVFNTYAFTNVQTMVHHGIQIVSGIYVAAYYRKRISAMMYLHGMAIFGVMLTIAIYLDTVFYDKLIALGKLNDGTKFNMFYISPRLGMQSPFFQDWFNSFRPPVYISLYAAGIIIASALIVVFGKLIGMFCAWISSKCRKHEVQIV
jgi:hypothetical protein